MKKRIIIISIITILVITSIILYGFFISKNNIKTNEIKLVSNTITDDYNGIKVVHISDLYYKKELKEKYLEKIVNEINLLKPDILVITGDILNKDINYNEDDIKKLTNYIDSIKTTLGKYIIKGDNDSSELWDVLVKESSLTDMNDNYKLIFSNTTIPILISGINSRSSDEFKSKIDKLNEDINSLEIKPCYSILLIHEPDYIIDSNLSNYNLILAGHSLGGVKIPIIGRIYNDIGSKNYNYGKYEIDNSILYVSNGLSSPKLKYRLSNEPSINFYRIVK